MSHSEINADIVLRACEAYMENRNRHILKVKEELIASEMQPWRFLWFKGRGKTREQAIENLENQRWSEYGMIEIQGGYWARKVEELMSLCRAPGVKTVKLSAEDAGLLAGFFIDKPQ